MEIARHIIDNNTTVRKAAKHFGISKSTVHAVVTIQNGMKRIPHILEKSDNYCLENKEKHTADKTDSEMHNKVWSEAAKLRTGEVRTQPVYGEICER